MLGEQAFPAQQKPEATEGRGGRKRRLDFPDDSGQASVPGCPRSPSHALGVTTRLLPISGREGAERSSRWEEGGRDLFTVSIPIFHSLVSAPVPLPSPPLLGLVPQLAFSLPQASPARLPAATLPQHPKSLTGRCLAALSLLPHATLPAPRGPPTLPPLPRSRGPRPGSPERKRI